MTSIPRTLKGCVTSMDRVMMTCVLALTICGIFCVYSAASGAMGRGWSLALRQAGWTVVSCAALLAVSLVGHERLMSVAWPIYGLTLLLLLSTAILAPRVKGAQSWLSVAGLRFQPSELAKVSLILALSKVLSRRPPFDARSFAVGLGTALPAVILVAIQPDVGSALVYLAMTMGMLLAAGAPWRYLGAVLGAGLMTAPLSWLALKDYQRMRLLVFLDPMRDPLGAGYNVIQSRIAVGSGGAWGKGFMMGTQSKLRFLPEPHTDFIFSVCSEELGFFGDVAILLLFAIILWRIIKAGMRSRDRRCKILVAGVAVWIWSQMFESMGMSIGLLPVTGLPLPFISYGGSSLLAIFIAIGLVGSIYIDGARRPWL